MYVSAQASAFDKEICKRVERATIALHGSVKGQCYPAAEALHHILWGAPAGYTPMVAHVRDRGRRATHWYVRYTEAPGFYRYLDPTADQFDPPLRDVDYACGRGCGFLTRQPSKRAQAIMDEYFRALDQDMAVGA